MTDAPITQLCQYINELSDAPRPPRSAEELKAARYIEQKLKEMNVSEIEEEVFYSIGKMSERLGAVGVLAGAGMLVGAGEARWRRVLGALLMVGAALSAREILKGRTPPWENFYPQRRSQNIIGRIPPSGELRDRIVFLAHMDTDIARLTDHAQLREYAPYFYAGLPNVALLGSMLTLLNAPIWMRQMVAYILFGEAGLNVANEIGKSTTGANDNASGVAILLALAEAVAATPLDHTEVVIAFTGCGTVAGQGAAELVREYSDMWADATWIALDNVGAGELCWASEHGWSSNAHYYPHPETVELLTVVASKYPHLGIMGKPMVSLDDVAPLRHKGLKAAAIMGYERSTGFFSKGETPEEIQPSTLARTWEYVWGIMKEIDTRDSA